MKITIIGAGHVGGQVADRLIFQELSDNVVLLDINKKLAMAKAKDISHAKHIYKFNSKIIGTDDYEYIENSNIIVITAGRARSPGMSREDLAKVNLKILNDITKNILKYSPDSIIIIVTNPVDILTYFIQQYGCFDRHKIIGMAGILDSARLSYILNNRMPHVNSDLIDSTVIGPHGTNMICLKEHTFIKNKNISSIFSSKELLEIFEEVSLAGADLVSLYSGNSAYLGPSAAVAKMVESIIQDSDDIFPCSVLLNGEYGINDVCLGVPVKLSKKGIKNIVEINLNKEDKNKLENIAKIYKQKINSFKDII